MILYYIKKFSSYYLYIVYRCKRNYVYFSVFYYKYEDLSKYTHLILKRKIQLVLSLYFLLFCCMKIIQEKENFYSLLSQLCKQRTEKK